MISTLTESYLVLQQRNSLEYTVANWPSFLSNGEVIKLVAPSAKVFHERGGAILEGWVSAIVKLKGDCSNT